MEFSPKDLPVPDPNVRVRPHLEYSGKIIRIKDEFRNKNPRSDNAKGEGWKAFNLILSKGGSISFEEYRKLGGRNDHIKWDLGYRLDGSKTNPYVELVDNTIPGNSKTKLNVTAMDSKPPLNQILFGPPGTGKTYATTKLAVDIITGKSKNSATNERSEIRKEYRRLMEAGRIKFVTFHQSYGYEEFVEGIKPNLDEGDTGNLKYRIKPGIFKQICERANAPLNSKLHDSKETSVTSNTISGDNFIGRKVWGSNLGLWNKYREGYREDCFDNDYFCLPLRKTSREIGDLNSDEYSSERNKRPRSVLYRFYNTVSEGDLIILSDNKDGICAIGILGEYSYQEDRDYCRHTRNVKWLWNTYNDKESITNFNINKDNLIPRSRFVYDTQINSKDLINYLLNNNITGKVSEKIFITGEVSDNTNADILNNHVLIIDEINRGNISKILGELITLLEDDKRLGEDEELKVNLPYSRESFGVPSNLYIIGTMNTADRSIAFLDTALRRRFQFKEKMPKPSLLSDDMSGINLQELLKIINERITEHLDRDHQIGHSYFMGDRATTIDALANTFRNNICPLLDEYFYDRRESIPAILNNSALINKKNNDWEWAEDDKGDDAFMQSENYRKIYADN